MSTYQFKNQTGFYQGKVRDVYTIGAHFVVMVVSDRISAFDVVLPKAIPYKGQVLNETALYFLKATSSIIRNWVLAAPLPTITIGLKCKTFPVEMVVRGYLAGHAWREYQSGKRSVCGVALPEGLRENDPLPSAIITPTTKASEGHDEDISKEEIIARGIISKEVYEKIEQYALSIFSEGQKMAASRNLILVDTKYEFGFIGDEIILIDEIHTPDSSRYFYAEGYNERQQKGEQQHQLSKEFVRKWLIENNFQGKEGQQVPEMTATFVQQVSDRYIELFESITGNQFAKGKSYTKEEIEEVVNTTIEQLSIEFNGN